MLKMVAFISGCRKFLCVMSGPSRTIHVTLFNDLRVRSKYLRESFDTVVLLCVAVF